MSCDRCPCRDVCLELPTYCRWAAKDPADPVELRHICDASTRLRAAGEPAAQYPPLATQAGNLAGALGRVVAAIAHGQPVKVSAPVYYERLAICRGCDFNGERPIGVRCTKCGCGEMKLQIATEVCPVGKW